MSTRTISIKFRIQKNGFLQVHTPNAEIDLLPVDDKEAIADAVLLAVRADQQFNAPSHARQSLFDDYAVPEGSVRARAQEGSNETPGISDSAETANQEKPPLDAEPVSEYESTRADHNEVETHVRGVIDGMIPGGSRIIDILQDLSGKQ